MGVLPGGTVNVFAREVGIPLNLNGAKLTDAGLAQLATLDNLQQLQLVNSGVTSAGIKELKAKLPNCQVTR